MGLIYALRRPRRNSFDDEEADYGYEEERPRHPRSNSRYSHAEDEDDYAQIDHQRPPSHSNGARNSRVPQRERRRDGY